MDLGGSSNDDVNDICHACKGKKIRIKNIILHTARELYNVHKRNTTHAQKYARTGDQKEPYSKHRYLWHVSTAWRLEDQRGSRIRRSPRLPLLLPPPLSTPLTTIAATAATA